MYEGVLITRRRLLLKASAVTPDQLKSYKVFQKAISDDRDRYIFLKAPAHVGAKQLSCYVRISTRGRCVVLQEAPDELLRCTGDRFGRELLSLEPAEPKPPLLPSLPGSDF